MPRSRDQDHGQHRRKNDKHSSKPTDQLLPDDVSGRDPSASENEEAVSFSLENLRGPHRNKHAQPAAGADLPAPKQVRCCPTDIICCFVFLAYVTVLFGTSIYLFVNSSINQPRDLDGNPCKIPGEILWNRYCIPDPTHKIKPTNYKRGPLLPAVTEPEVDDDDTSATSNSGDKVIEKCPRWHPGPAMQTQQVQRRKKDKRTGKLVDLPKRWLPVDFASRYVPTLNRCVRYKVQSTKYCMPRDTMCFGLTTKARNNAAMRTAMQLLLSDTIVRKAVEHTDHENRRENNDHDQGFLRLQQQNMNEQKFISNQTQQSAASTSITGATSTTINESADGLSLWQRVFHKRNDQSASLTPQQIAPEVDQFDFSTFTNDENNLEFRGCCPEQVAAAFPKLSTREKLFLNNDVDCYYTDAYGQFLPFNDATRSKLVENYEQTIADSATAKSKNNRITQILWLVNNKQMMNYQNLYEDAVKEEEQSQNPQNSYPNRQSSPAFFQSNFAQDALNAFRSQQLVLKLERPILNPSTTTADDLWSRTEKQSSAHFTKSLRSKFCASEYYDDANSSQAEEENEINGLLAKYGFQIYDLVRLEWKLVLLFGIFLPILFGFVAIYLIPYCMKLLTWLIYIVAFTTIILGNFLLLIKSGWLPEFLLNELDDEGPCDFIPTVFLYHPSEAAGYRKWSVLALIGGSVLLLLLVLLKRRIDLGLKLLQTTGTIILQLPGILWFGVLGIAQTIAILLVLGIPLYLAYQTTPDEIKSIAIVQTICGDSFGKELLGEDTTTCCESLNWIYFCFMLFGFVWFLLYSFAVMETCTAMCVSKWYFERHDPKSMFYDLEHDRACFRPIWLIAVVLGKHTGTCAFGSFLLAVCWTLQILYAVLEWAKQKAKKTVSSTARPLTGTTSGSGESSSSSCCSCCSLEKILLAINYAIMYICGQAFVFVAIEGCNFCKSAMKVTKLMLKHPVQCAMNLFLTRIVSGLLLLLVPLSIALLTFLTHNVGLFQLFANGFSGKNSCSKIAANGVYNKFLAFQEEGISLPMFCCILSVFLMFTLCKTYSTAVDALYICIYRDLDSFDGRYLNNSPELHSLWKKSGKESGGKHSSEEEE
ncbi:unnamed protein product [Amoebophrya sp. A120]|nr:unnamed protein product [Amoebophrya sp. A120]|eukprot:GSA120T00012349001.1